MHKIDEVYTKYPFYGYRRQYLEIIENGFSIGEDRVRQLMREMELKVFHPKKTTIGDKKPQIYPYLLRELIISKPGQVWACDITYIKMLDKVLLFGCGDRLVQPIFIKLAVIE